MQTALIAALTGLGTGMSLIVAIGAQNAFVLRQGLRREHVLIVVTVCALSDLVLIGLGIGGVGAAVDRRPDAVRLVSWLGGAFLCGYGVLAARRALRPEGLAPGDGRRLSARATAVTCLALTWLNPHVYLDTVLLLGSLANGYGAGRWPFGAGAGVASVLWFTGLGFGARLLSGPFSRPSAWRVLDALIACVMVALGVRMALRG